MENNWLERKCAYAEFRLFDPRSISMFTKHGIPCMKFQGEMKVLSWCKKEGELCSASGPDCLPINTAPLGGVNLTLIDSRPSPIHPCKIFDVTIRGIYGSHQAGWEECFIMIIDGLLLCVDEQDVIPEYQLVTIYPTIEEQYMEMHYRICSENVILHCPGPANIASIAQPEEEIGDFTWGQGA